MKTVNQKRPGYKKTKVGRIPKEWECVHLHDAFTEGKRRGEKGLPILSVTMDRGMVRRDTLDRKMAPDLPAEMSLLVEPNDVAYNMMRMWQGAVGVCAERGVVSPAYVVCRPIARRVNPRFMFYYFKSQAGLYRLWAYSFGITGDRLRLYFNDFCLVPAPLPPLAEQKKIADVLTAWNDAIGQMRKLIEAKKRRKKGLMQQLPTGKRRLPGFAKTKKYVPHRFFKLPADWGHLQLREIASERSERNGQVRNATVLSCSKYRGFVLSSEYFGKQVFSEDTSNYKVVRKGWFGFPANHVEEGSIGLLKDFDVGIVSPIYIVFSVCNRVLPEYLYAVFKTETFRHIFAISTNASVDRRGSLRWREFGLIQVPLPSLPEQRAITAVLRTADEEITHLEAELAALEKQKRGLMQKLLTGAVRVKV